MIYTHKYVYGVNLWSLSLSLLSALEAFHSRLSSKHDLILHYGVEGQHFDRGFHPLGKAVDLHIEYDGSILPIREQYDIAGECWRGGMGVYPFWQHKGLHLDLGDPSRRWWRDVSGQYQPMSSIDWTEFI